jgi:MFS family permease
MLVSLFRPTGCQTSLSYLAVLCLCRFLAAFCGAAFLAPIANAISDELPISNRASVIRRTDPVLM